MSTIPLDQVIARAKVQARESSSAKDLDYEIYAMEAMDHLNCLSAFEEQEEILDVVDGKAKLPCGFYKELGIRTYDDEGCCTCGSTVYVNTIFLRRCCIPIQPYYRPCYEFFKIIGGYIHLNMPTDVTKIQLVFAGLPKDEHGLTVIKQRYERAIANYILWMDGLSPGTRLTPGQTGAFGRIWGAQKDMLAGQDNVIQWELERWWIGEAILNKINISPKM